MSTNLLNRFEKLEASAGTKDNIYLRAVRLIVNQGEEDEAYRQAEEMGLDLSPGSEDLLIIRLLVPPPIAISGEMNSLV